jgi:uncharacterized protein YjbI with pentapeptide repeats
VHDIPAVEPADLVADCGNCFALCCVALPFAASADFAFDKPAATPCRNLSPDLRCTIHAELRPRGFAGCAAYDCQGAGQKISQVTLGGRDWRADPQAARQLQLVYPVVRQLHEMLRYLTEARDLVGAAAAGDLGGEVDATLERVNGLTFRAAEELVNVDVAAQRADVGALLERGRARTRAPVPSTSLRNADLVGADLRGRELARNDLRGALLIAADLRGADLRGADLLGADLRDADVRGADLTGCLFITQAQLQAARGDTATRLSAQHDRPVHWKAG